VAACTVDPGFVQAVWVSLLVRAWRGRPRCSEDGEGPVWVRAQPRDGKRLQGGGHGSVTKRALKVRYTPLEDAVV